MAQTAAEAVKCPAGRGIGHTLYGPACRCYILHETITRDQNSSTLKAYCAGDYTQCNVWRAKRDAEIEKRAKELQSDIDRSAKGTRALPVVVG